jgi:protein-S-isoprenylcysteine O-methyltransferase Ste14
MSIISRLFAALWLAFWLYWLISAFQAKKSKRTNAMWTGIGFRLVLVLVVIWLFRNPAWKQSGIRSNAYTHSPVLAGAGLLVCAGGLMFAVWARRHLGRNWGMPMSLREQPELVTSGPYAYVRHPIYSGLLVALLGSALASGPWWLMIAIICGTYFIYSATREERMMTQEFPDQYPGYQQRTKMLIPFVL